MFTLKTYQQQTLEKLEAFLRRAATTKNPTVAYEECIRETYRRESNYNDAGFPNVPYVCLRLPTGGGKTFLASHSIALACKEYIGKDVALVLWLVPSSAILEQTLKALRDRRHPYRVVLDEAFDGNVSIRTVEETLGISRSDLAGNLVVVVSTLAAWRVDRTEGRRVYESGGVSKDHFEFVPKELLENLERHDSENGGALKYSLANLVHLHRPIVIVDEAHNARTDLTFDTLKRLNPSCIIEYTATPKVRGSDRSNVLYNVSAAELKSEHVIKLPIELLTLGEWQQTVSNAVTKQRELEAVAKEEEQTTGEYIRPIVLLQAEADRVGQTTINVNEVKKCLLEQCNVPEEEIAIATGEERGIEGIDLLQRDCKIRFIITKQALKEGWDCPFAYVFCSVAKVRSSKDVEQLLGRVLRMPNVAPKQQDPLNRAYAFVHSRDFYETASNLTDSLTRCGFEPNDASRFLEIKNIQVELGLDLFSQLTRTLSSAPEPTALPRELREKVKVNAKDNTITLVAKITEEEKKQLTELVESPEDKQVIEQLYRAVHRIPMSYTSPAKRGEVFSVPQLLIEFDGELRPFDEEILIPPSWNLAEHHAELSETEFPIKVDVGTRGLIDVDSTGKAYFHNPNQIQQELTSILVSSRMHRPELVVWLVKETRHPSIPHAQAVVFVNKVLETLIQKCGLDIDHLVYVRFRLKEAIKKKVAEHIEATKKMGYQDLLFADRVKKGKGKFSVGEDIVFPREYPANSVWKGNWQPERHFYEVVADMNDEEAECAFIIDHHPNVEYWVRNLERQEHHSFWLQTSTDKFYPDFVVKLKNGKIVAVEYKRDKDYSADDSKEKRWIGEFWETSSSGLCCFLMTKGKEWDKVKQKLNL